MKKRRTNKNFGRKNLFQQQHFILPDSSFRFSYNKVAVPARFSF